MTISGDQLKNAVESLLENEQFIDSYVESDDQTDVTTPDGTVKPSLQKRDRLLFETGHPGRIDNPHSVTKAQVGLGAADNTSDNDKPVSTAQQAAIDLKLNKNGSNAESGIVTQNWLAADLLATLQTGFSPSLFGGTWNPTTDDVKINGVSNGNLPAPTSEHWTTGARALGNGSNTRIRFNTTIVLSGDFVLSFKLRSGGAWGTEGLFASGTSLNYVRLLNDTTVELKANGAVYTVDFNSPLPTDIDLDVKIVRSSNVVSLILNGVTQTDTVTMTSEPLDISGLYDRRSDQAGNPLEGYMWDVVIDNNGTIDFSADGYGITPSDWADKSGNGIIVTLIGDYVAVDAEGTLGAWYVIDSEGTATGTEADGSYLVDDILIDVGGGYSKKPAPTIVNPNGSIPRTAIDSGFESDIEALENDVSELKTNDTNTKTVSISNSEAVLVVGDSYTASGFTVKGKSWIAKVSQYLDVWLDSMAQSGDTYLNQYDKILDNNAEYGLAIQNGPWKWAILNCYTNDAKNPTDFSYADILRNTRRVCEILLSLGVTPILAPEYHNNYGKSWITGLKQLSEELFIPLINIHEDTLTLRGADYAPFWSGTHPGTRANDLIALPFEQCLKTGLPRPERCMKIFRVRSEVTVSSVADLLYHTIEERAKLFKEIELGHTFLSNPQYLDAVPTNDTKEKQNSEYGTLINNGRITMSSYNLVETVLPVTLPGITSLDITWDHSEVLSNLAIFSTDAQYIQLTSQINISGAFSVKLNYRATSFASEPNALIGENTNLNFIRTFDDKVEVVIAGVSYTLFYDAILSAGTIYELEFNRDESDLLTIKVNGITQTDTEAGASGTFKIQRIGARAAVDYADGSIWNVDINDNGSPVYTAAGYPNGAANAAWEDSSPSGNNGLINGSPPTQTIGVTPNVYIRRSLENKVINDTEYQGFVITSGQADNGDTYQIPDSTSYNVVATVTDPRDNSTLLICTTYNEEKNTDTGGTLTRTSGTGDATLTYSKIKIAYDVQWYENFGKPEGSWLQLTNVNDVYSVPTDKIKGAVFNDKVSFLIEGAVDIKEPIVSVKGGRMKTPSPIGNFSLPRARGPELLDQNFDNWINSGGIKIASGALADSNVPSGITDIYELDAGDSLETSVSHTSDIRYDDDALIEIVARRFPDIYNPVNGWPGTSVITEDTYDEGEIVIRFSADGDTIAFNKKVGLHWGRIRIPIKIPSGITSFTLNLQTSLHRLQIATASLRMNS